MLEERETLNEIKEDHEDYKEVSFERHGKIAKVYRDGQLLQHDLIRTRLPQKLNRTLRNLKKRLSALRAKLPPISAPVSRRCSRSWTRSSI